MMQNNSAENRILVQAPVGIMEQEIMSTTTSPSRICNVNRNSAGDSVDSSDHPFQPDHASLSQILPSIYSMREPNFTGATAALPTTMETMLPMMTGRIGGVASHLRDGPSGNSGAGASPGAGGSGGGIPDPSATIVPLSENGAGIQRISPDQEMHTARVEATQEIRQLREQQTQDALTNRVKQLSMASGSMSDKERFLRSMQSPNIEANTLAGVNMQERKGDRKEAGKTGEISYAEVLTDEPQYLDNIRGSRKDDRSKEGKRMSGVTSLLQRAPITLMQEVPPRVCRSPSPEGEEAAVTKPRGIKKMEEVAALVMAEQEVIRKIAHRVSQQLREAKQKGESGVDYQRLIAKEIVREQRAGSLPASMARSEPNSGPGASATRTLTS